MGGIKRYNSSDIHNALVGANTPSASNVFATVNDITGIFLPLAGGTMTGTIVSGAFEALQVQTDGWISLDGAAANTYLWHIITDVSTLEITNGNTTGKIHLKAIAVGGTVGVVAGLNSYTFAQDTFTLDNGQDIALPLGGNILLHDGNISTAGRIQWDSSNYIIYDASNEGVLELHGESSAVWLIGSSGTFETNGTISDMRSDSAMYPTLRFNNTTANVGSLTSTNLTAIRTWTLPDATGTIALTSDLSGYLPLSGGTMTGNIQMGGDPSGNGVLWGTKRIGVDSNGGLELFGDAANIIFTCDSSIDFNSGIQQSRWYDGATNYGLHTWGTLTGLRTWTWQDASGTVAFLSDFQTGQTYTVSNTVTQRTLDGSLSDIDNLYNVVGTLIQDLQSKNIVS